MCVCVENKRILDENEEGDWERKHFIGEENAEEKKKKFVYSAYVQQ